MQGREEIQNPTQRRVLMEGCKMRSDSESWSSHQKEVTGKLVASRNSGTSESSKAGSRKWPHNFHMSPVVAPHMEKVFSIVRQIDLNDFDVNSAVWSIFMNVTLQAAAHLGRDYIWRMYVLPRINS